MPSSAHVTLAFLAPLAWVLGACVVAGLVVCIVLWVRKSRRRQAEHKQTHPPMSAEEFLAGVGIRPEYAAAALIVRKAVGRVLHVPTETVYPSETLAYVDTFSATGDECLIDLVMALGEALGFPMSTGFCMTLKYWRAGAPQATVADLTRHLAPRIAY